MFARLRWLAAVLLLLVPLQGLAAATRMLCGSAHAPAAHSVVAAEHAHAAPETQLHRDADSQGHGRAAGETSLSADSGDPGFAFSAGSCAHCAGCSVGSALTGGVMSLPSIAPAHPAFPAREISYASRPFDGPERPPRTI